MTYKYNIFTSNFDIVGNGSGSTQQITTSGTCNSGVNVLDVVYIDSSGIYQQADASLISTAKAIGIILSKSTSTECKLIITGTIDGFTGLNPGDVYFLSETPGQITNIKPSSGSVIFPIGKSISSTTMIVNFANNYTITN